MENCLFLTFVKTLKIGKLNKLWKNIVRNITHKLIQAIVLTLLFFVFFVGGCCLKDFSVLVFTYRFW